MSRPYENGVLKCINNDDQGTDYKLHPQANSCWILVGNISVYVIRKESGVEVELYPRNHEDRHELDWAHASFDEAQEVIDDINGELD